MRHSICLSLVILLSATSSFAQQTPFPTALRTNLDWQISLEREGFSPGIIDGKIGAKTALATTEFQFSRGLPRTGRLDPATTEAMGIGKRDAISTYTIQPADLASVTGETTDWIARSRMESLGYGTLLDALAEKFHCSRPLLLQLNPGVNIAALPAGATLNVPVVDAPKSISAQSLVVNLSQKSIRAFNGDGVCIALFHCSIATDAAKRPSGETTVTSVIPNPSYTFDPVHWPEVKDVHQKLLIPPGPRNPVGVCWIGLNLPGYGLHGTPWPELIGKTGSHGCFRLTNWDAQRLGKMIRPGMTVKFLGDSPSTVADAR